MSVPLNRVRFNSPRFLRVPARIANRLGLVPPFQVAEEATRDIRDSVRRNLENQYSSSESFEAREQDDNDNLEQDRQSVSRVTVRRNYSPISVDSIRISLFEPNPARNMDNEAVDREIERLRAQQAGQNAAANYEDARSKALVIYY